MRRDAFFRDAVHLLGTDLYFELVAALAHHRRMQRLVHVRPRHSDKVLNASRHRAPDGMNEAEHGITITNGRCNHANGEQIEDLIDGAGALVLQFLVNAVQALDAPLHARLDIVFGKLVVQRLHYRRQKLFALDAPCIDRILYLFIAKRIHVAERQVFELATHLAHAQAVRQRRVDIQRLPCNGLLPLRLQVLQRAHIVEAVCKLDEHHAHVADHRQQHFADVLGLPVLTVRKLDLVDLGDAFDDVRDLVAELLRNVRRRHRRIFNRVMQQSRRDGRGIQLHVGQHQRYFQGMQHVGLTRCAQLAGVMQDAEIPGAANDVGVFGWAVGFQGIDELEEFLVRNALARTQARTRTRTAGGQWRSSLQFSLQAGGAGSRHTALYVVRKLPAFRACDPIAQERFSMLAVPLLLALVATLPVDRKSADKPLPDAQHLLDLALQDQKRLEDEQERYSCKVHTEMVRTDSKGKLKDRDTKEEEQFFVNGHEIDRTLTRDGKPLDAKAAKKEDERVSKEAKKYSDPSQRIKADNENEKDVEAALRVIKLSGERRATVDDRPTIFFHIEGNPDAKPKDLSERAMQAVAGTMALDEATGELLDLDVKTAKDVKVGGGLVGDLHKGFALHVRQAPQPDGIWLTEIVEGSGDARAALFFHPYFHFKQQNSGCQLYTVDSSTKTKSPGK